MDDNFRALDDEDRNTVDDWVGAAAFCANQPRSIGMNVAVASRTRQLREQGWVEDWRWRLLFEHAGLGGYY
jgi:hypothetical protein